MGLVDKTRSIGPPGRIQAIGLLAKTQPIGLLDKTHPPAYSTDSAHSRDEGYDEERLGILQGHPKHDKIFDYIVVGGGTAGNAIGVRLAEAGFHVAIVEAGSLYEDKDHGIHTIPGQDIVGVGSQADDVVESDVDWKFHTVPQPGANNRKMHFARGRCLGGSSALNFMIYHRGTRGTYDRWADDVGDDSYRIDNFLPFFKKSVSATAPDTNKRKANASTSTHFDAHDFAPLGQGGPVQVSYPHWVSSWSTWLEQGLRSVGLKRTDGYNHGNLIGYHYTTATINPKDATRSSSAQYVYWAKKKQLRNLKVFLRTHATKVLFKQKKAVGVTVDHYGQTYHLTARKEVILSAGAFQSPQLLMVSGIGPVETLRKFDIPTIVALPGVGQNMWDHIFYGPAYEVNFPTLNELLSDPKAAKFAEEQYSHHQAGPLTSNIIEFLGWEKLPRKYRYNFSSQTRKDLAQFPDDWPEVEYLGADGYIGDFTSPSKHQPPDGKMYASILGALVAPLSRGNITIRSASALDAPVISPNWLEDKGDQEVAIAWYRRMRDVWGTRALQSIVLGPEAYPGSDVQSDDEVLNLVRDSVMTVWHPACTCKMGKRNDKMAVVDHRARVYGVSGLRVVDASAMPFLPPGHPQSTIYALAEKIAYDIIRGERKDKYYDGAHDGEYRQGVYKGEHRQGGYGGEHRQGVYKGEHRQGGYDGEHQGVYKGEHRQGGYDDEHRHGGYEGEHRQGGYNGEHRQGVYKGEYRQGVYKGEYRQSVYEGEYGQGWYEYGY
ncbi:GMC oxidoreductase [Hirsutella rhossiliensis]|uniref:GMC oxidoreductase domain-containing protein n=1 Tax=Hirsutella rhossiliensis TaxID=111463 RepID=A0A9P8N185_9HYPO|nr:GMC oxidoreductase domain-containing protein [Hirsutella rhossiliensis]KAH0964732.1 GMC oxidoreductase domain-containing protein [Hirsutella rhossiliensis]